MVYTNARQYLLWVQLASVIADKYLMQKTKADYVFIVQKELRFFSVQFTGYLAIGIFLAS